MIWFIIGLVLYVAIGLFICGFMDVSVDTDSDVFYPIVGLWPIVIVGSLIVIIGQVPIRLGKKLGDKYLSVVESMLQKLLNN